VVGEHWVAPAYSMCDCCPAVLGRPLTLTLLARRSRHFAGTRFKKRGLNNQGKVQGQSRTKLGRGSGCVDAV
jgi:hypothetical protein